MGGPAGAAEQQRRFDKAADYSEAHNGCALVVMQAGEVVYERYAQETTADTANFIASATKSFWGPTVAAAIADGLISSFDEPAAATLTEWRSDPRKAKISLRQILSLTSGVRNDLAAIQGEGTAPDKYAFAVASPLAAEPGKAFTYGPVNYYLLGEILKRKLASRGQDPLAYLEQRLFNPIGLTYSKWERDQSGNPHMPNGCFIAAREWMKFGRLVLARGRHQGRQLIPADLLAQCFAPGSVNPGYGLTFWLNQPGGISTRNRAAAESPGGFLYRAGYPDLAGAMGGGGNNLFIIPSLDLAVIKQTKGGAMRPATRTWEEQRRMLVERQRGYTDNAFLSLILTGEDMTT